MKTNITQELNYDVSGGDTVFDSVEMNGQTYISFQIYYTSLDQADHKIKIQESLDGVNFIDSVDSSSNIIEITLDNTITNDILKIVHFNTNYFRAAFVEGTAGTGTVDKIKIMTE
jgi:hypothetical protein